MLFTGDLEEFLVDCRLVLPPPAVMVLSAFIVPPVVVVAPSLSSLCPSPAVCHHPVAIQIPVKNCCQSRRKSSNQSVSISLTL